MQNILSARLKPSKSTIGRGGDSEVVNEPSPAPVPGNRATTVSRRTQKSVAFGIHEAKSELRPPPLLPPPPVPETPAIRTYPQLRRHKSLGFGLESVAENENETPRALPGGQPTVSSLPLRRQKSLLDIGLESLAENEPVPPVPRVPPLPGGRPAVAKKEALRALQTKDKKVSKLFPERISSLATFPNLPDVSSHHFEDDRASNYTFTTSTSASTVVARVAATQRQSHASISSTASGPRVSVSSTPSQLSSTHTSQTTVTPIFDRTTDIVWRRYPHRTAAEQEAMDALAFSQNRARLVRESAMFASQNDLHPYFRLPDSVRFRIAKYVLADAESDEKVGQKTIRLNPPSYLHPAWPIYQTSLKGDYFVGLRTVLDALAPYLKACFGLRMDMLTALLLTRRFHVVFSPSVAPGVQPAATHWLERYGRMMKRMTIELDLTKLGGRSVGAATGSDEHAGLEDVRIMVDNFVGMQLTRRRTGDSRLEELGVLVRRYFNGLEDDSNLFVLNSLKYLGRETNGLYIVGTTRAFAVDLVQYVWRDMPADKAIVREHCGIRAPSRVYPCLPGQSSALDFGPNHGGVQITHRDSDPWRELRRSNAQRDGPPLQIRVDTDITVTFDSVKNAAGLPRGNTATIVSLSRVEKDEMSAAKVRRLARKASSTVIKGLASGLL